MKILVFAFIALSAVNSHAGIEDELREAKKEAERLSTELEAKNAYIESMKALRTENARVRVMVGHFISETEKMLKDFESLNEFVAFPERMQEGMKEMRRRLPALRAENSHLIAQLEANPYLSKDQLKELTSKYVSADYVRFEYFQQVERLRHAFNELFRKPNPELGKLENNEALKKFRYDFLQAFINEKPYSSASEGAKEMKRLHDEIKADLKNLSPQALNDQLPLKVQEKLLRMMSIPLKAGLLYRIKRTWAKPVQTGGLTLAVPSGIFGSMLAIQHMSGLLSWNADFALGTMALAGGGVFVVGAAATLVHLSEYLAYRHEFTVLRKPLVKTLKLFENLGLFVPTKPEEFCELLLTKRMPRIDAKGSSNQDQMRVRESKLTD